jgi:hypothetical protein
MTTTRWICNEPTPFPIAVLKRQLPNGVKAVQGQLPEPSYELSAAIFVVKSVNISIDNMGACFHDVHETGRVLHRPRRITPTLLVHC